MIKEIGSSFWEFEVDNKQNAILEENYQILLTGRTALDYIIKDIKAKEEIKSVYMPSYCCHTMIKPFFDNGIEVEFYDMDFENGEYIYKVDFETKCDLVLIMGYFGFYNEVVDLIIEGFKAYGKIIIEDATHSWFSKKPYSKKSDYVFTSLRKWTGLPGGALAIKRYDHFYYPLSNDTNNRYMEIREKAIRLKKLYIKKNKGEKEVFLKMFNDTENILEDDYQEYRIPNYYEKMIARLDIDKIKLKRQKNAKTLIKGLKDLKTINTIVEIDKAVPLYLPIIVLEKKRDELREHLIKNHIYCPVHWPLSRFHKIEDTTLYDNSLSLICDQRYSNTDMNKIINKINTFYGK